MIPTFEDYINESLWSKGVERSHSGERRTEDKFTQGDIENFNQKIYHFMKKYDLGNTIDDFWEKSDETFEKPILDYAKSHGTLRLGFGPRDLSNLPDFDYTFYIPDLKNVMVHISYDDFEKEFKVMCGNDKDEFDIKDTTIGKYLITCITDILPQTLKKNPDVLLLNIKKNWKIFEKDLYDIVYRECYNNMMSNKKSNYMVSDIGAILSLVDLRNTGSEFDKFYMDNINMNTIPSRITIGNDIDVEKSNPLYKKIINVCKKAYKNADEDTEQFRRYR